MKFKCKLLLHRYDVSVLMFWFSWLYCGKRRLVQKQHQLYFFILLFSVLTVVGSLVLLELINKRQVGLFFPSCIGNFTHQLDEAIANCMAVVP